MKNTYLITLASAVLLLSCSQSQISRGDLAYQNMSYKKAVAHYEKAITPKTGPEIHLKIAQAYERMNNSIKAEEHYQMALASGKGTPDTKLQYAKVLLTNGKQKECEAWMAKYLEESPNDSNAIEWAARKTKEGQFADYDPERIEIEMIPLVGYSAAFSAYPHHDMVYFIAEKKATELDKSNPWNGQSFLDIHQVQRMQDDEWFAPQPVTGNINGLLHDGPLTIAANGKTAYITRSALDEKNRKKFDPARVNQLRISEYNLEADGSWTLIGDLPFNEASASTMHPSICLDEKTLFFASDRAGGQGGNDLYMAVYEGGAWSAPVNLGAEINSAGNEVFPFALHKDTLFFASDGLGGMGGLDVFISIFDGEKWSRPSNLKAPINTNFDDFSYYRNASKMEGYLSSNRSGKDQIYTWKELPPPVRYEASSLTGTAHQGGNEGSEQDGDAFWVHGVVLDKISKNKLSNVSVELLNGAEARLSEVQSDENGEFSFRLNRNEQYKVYVQRKNSFSRKATISTEGLRESKNFELVLELEELKAETSIALNHIYYDYNKSNIRKDAVGDLDNLLRFLKDNPQVKVEIGSYTDSRGSDKYNLDLSVKRAKSATDYLISRGISPARLQRKGYGESQLINNCTDDVPCSDEQHQQNRRTEFKVLELE